MPLADTAGADFDSGLDADRTCGSLARSATDVSTCALWLAIVPEPDLMTIRPE